MKCRDIQNILYTKTIDELSLQEKQFIINHVKKCDECKRVFDDAERADSILYKIRNANLELPDEEILTRSIMNEIKIDGLNKADLAGNSFWETLIYFVSQKRIRFAMGMVLVFFVLLFFYQEYDAVRNISVLEQKLNKIGNENSTTANVLHQEIGSLEFFYNAYNFVEGNKPLLELSNELVMIKRGDLENLLKDYMNLDEESKVRIQILRDQLLKKYETKMNDNFVVSEKKSFTEDIKTLNKELKKVKTTGGK